MRCPHCGKTISDYSVRCPNCGGDPKGTATSEVTEKIRKRSDRRSAVISLASGLAALAAGVLLPYLCLYVFRWGANRTNEMYVYLLAAVILTVICIITKAFPVIVKNIPFYVLSVAAAATDVFLTKIMYDRAVSFSIIPQHGLQSSYYGALAVHCIVLILGIALVMSFACRMFVRDKTEPDRNS